MGCESIKNVMNMFRRTLHGLIILLLILVATPLCAQVKYEKESRMKESDVPEPAYQFIDSLELDRKVKWYLEQGLERTTVEAKYKLDGSRHSIEFDREGNLEDAEIEVDWGDMSESLKEKIIDQLCEDCWKVKIQKVQIQYTGDPQVILRLLKTGDKSGEYTLRYEIVMRCRTPDNTTRYEYLYSADGEKLSRAEIVFQNATNLEY